MPPGAFKPSHDAEHGLIIRRLGAVMLLRRSSVKDGPTDSVDLDGELDEPTGKGRPTPKRAAARQARRNQTPKNRKEAAALVRDKRRQERIAARQALVTGDERNLPARDAGPEKRLARDVIDSRFTYGQVFFGLIAVVFLASLIPNTAIRTADNYIALFSLAMMFLDGATNGRRARRAVAAKYGKANARGIALYAFMRALFPRRLRRPPPKVKRGGALVATEPR